METVIKCICGSDVYRATLTVPVSMQVSTDGKALDFWGMWEEDFADLEVTCDGCEATLGHDDLPRSPNRRADQDQTPALIVARTVIMETLMDAVFITDLGK
jgi:hypothetical protein